MKEWSDKELDKLLQKSAEELDPPYEPADWQQLRRRLDEAEGITPGGGWLKEALPYLAIALLLLLGGLGLYYGTDGETGTSERSSRRAADRPSSQVPPAERAPATPPNRNALELKKEEVEIGKNGAEPPLALPRARLREETSASDARTDLKELPRNLASASGVRQQPNRSDQERGEGAILLPKGTSAQPSQTQGTPPAWKDRAEVPGPAGQKQPDSPPVSIESRPPLPGPGDQTAPSQIRADEGTPRRDFVGMEPRASRKNFLMATPLPYPRVVYSPGLPTGGIPGSPEVKVPRWSVRMGVSPDLSVVRMTDMMHSMRPGPSAALLVERSIGKEWSLQTGIIRSLKNYSVPFNDYHPAQNIIQTTMPVMVDGKSTVFEVPLNVRFDFSQRQKTRWFVGTGVSSYKMQKEKYTYHYDTYVHNGAKGWGGSTGWYLLSHANASVGYERRLSERLSIVAEPYLRIPLRGIGFGKVDLFTGGVWFSLRYTPAFRKN